MNAKRSARCGACVAVGVMLFATCGFAAEPAPDKDAPPAEPSKAKADEAEIAKLIEQLGSDKYKQREAAQAALIAIGEPAAGQLAEALDSPDAEVRARAEMALAEVRKSAFERASEAIAKNVLWKLDVAEGILGPPVATGTAVLFVSRDYKLRAVSAADRQPLWSVPADPYWRVVVTETAAYLRDTEGMLRAVDLKTGKPLAGFEPSKVALRSVAYADGVIYALASTGGFVALDARTGEQRWKVPLALEDESREKLAQARAERLKETQLGGWVRPVVAKGLVFISTGAGEIAAVDVRDGEQKWKKSAGAPLRSLVFCEGLLIVRTSAGLRAFDADGETKWELPPPADEARTVMGPVGVVDLRSVMRSDDSAVRSREMAVSGGIIYLTAGGQVVAVDTKKGAKQWSWKPKADSAVEAVRMGGTTVIFQGGGQVVIRGSTGVGPLGATTGLTSPAVSDGAVYVGSRGGLHAIDPKTRQQLWRLKTPQPVAATPVVRDGVIYFVTSDAAPMRLVGGALPRMAARLHAVRLKAKE